MITKTEVLLFHDMGRLARRTVSNDLCIIIIILVYDFKTFEVKINGASKKIIEKN